MKRRRRRAFTLVELLVVIGIIAALIGILLPVLSGVASRGRDIQCQSNLRTIVQLVMTYAAENKGQLPYGLYYQHGKSYPGGDWSREGSDPTLITLWSILSRMSNKSYSGEDQFVSSSNPQNDPAKNTAPFLRCPEAMQVLPHVCSYVGNFVAFIDPHDDVRVGADPSPEAAPHTRLVTVPTRIARLLPFTALVWDTCVVPGMQFDVGFITGADIDNQQFWAGAIRPQRRYYNPDDPLAAFGPQYSNNANVVMLVGTAWKNIDPPGDPANFGFTTAQYPYQGNLRYRHNKNTTCNIGFSDGHVGQWVGKFKGDGGIIKYEAPRKSFMVRWPTGISPDPSIPG